MEVGNLVQWRVKEGDQVEAGSILADIETDKATLGVPMLISDAVSGFSVFIQLFSS